MKILSRRKFIVMAAAVPVSMTISESMEASGLPTLKKNGSVAYKRSSIFIKSKIKGKLAGSVSYTKAKEKTSGSPCPIFPDKDVNTNG